MTPMSSKMFSFIAHADPAWRYHLAGSLFALVSLWPLLVLNEFKPWLLLDAKSLGAMSKFLAGFFPPAHSVEFLSIVTVATWLTIAIATAGMTLALLGAIPLTLLVTERLSISCLGARRMSVAGALVCQVTRWLLVLLRSMPELVWALLLVRITGLGPTAGVIAIALTYCGMLGKVYAEILESSGADATEALLANGSRRLAALLYGALPESAGELVPYTVYRVECAIRGSTVMVFVGGASRSHHAWFEDSAVGHLAGADGRNLCCVAD